VRGGQGGYAGRGQPGYGGQPRGGPGGYAGRDDGRGGWNRGWRGDQRYNWGGYRDRNRGAFRLPRYYAPPSWHYGYRRFSVGVTLGYGLFGGNYWIDDPYAYRLPPAYGPYRWVRYYNDALLVDTRSGYVVDAVYDIFW
jgi:Ni/Co efflux regulator RcnB